MNQQNWQRQLRQFVQDRKWEQFHNPKNLVLALMGELGELSEQFTWLDGEESKKIMNGPNKEAVEDELADIFIYLLRLCDVLNVDLDKIFNKKMEKNSKKYTRQVCQNWDPGKQSRLHPRNSSSLI